VVRIEIPSLRCRPEDIPLLAQGFMRELSREYGRDPKRLGSEALAALQAYDWPGEILELRNLIERLLLGTPGDVVRVDDLPVPGSGGAGESIDLYGEFSSLAEGVRVFERYHARRILTALEEQPEAAARRLGVSVEELGRLLQD